MAADIIVVDKTHDWVSILCIAWPVSNILYMHTIANTGFEEEVRKQYAIRKQDPLKFPGSL